MMKFREDRQAYHKWFKPIISHSEIAVAVDGVPLDKNRVFKYEVSSLADAVEFMKYYSGKVSPYKNCHNASEMTDRKLRIWSGTNSFQHMVNIFDSGIGIDSDVESMSKDLERIEQLEIEEPEYYFRETGLAVDVGKFMEGVPECFLDSEEVYQNEQVIQIDVLGSYDHRVNPQVVLRNMAKLIGYLKAYERRGLRIRVVMWIAGAMNEYRDESVDPYMLVIKHVIKGENDDYDLHKIACFLHPSYFRRGIFKFMEMSGQVMHKNYSVPILAKSGDLFMLDHGRTRSGDTIDRVLKRKDKAHE